MKRAQQSVLVAVLSIKAVLGCTSSSNLVLPEHHRADPDREVLDLSPESQGVVCPEGCAEFDALLKSTEVPLRTYVRPATRMLGPVPALPVSVDNSQLRHFPPVVHQQGASCAQVSGVAYVFTYEINRLRNLSAADPANRYPSSFTWNFLNRGVDAGSDTTQGWRILRETGCPSEAVYAGGPRSASMSWMSGYDKYRQAMKNRLSEFSAIHAGSPGGLETLKEYLAHHHGDNRGQGGGIGTLLVHTSGLRGARLPEDSPNAGMGVVTDWGVRGPHVVTVVGFDDEVRYDYNGDGLFTTDVDINGDQRVDMRDWEQGALIVANSWGPDWCNNGRCFVMYRTLAEEKRFGGVADPRVFVVSVHDPDYEPQLTARVRLRHDVRGSLRIRLEMSNGSTPLPAHALGFFMLNHKGGTHPLSAPDGTPLEIGLDLTPWVDQTRFPPPEAVTLVVEHQQSPERPLETGEIHELTVLRHNAGEERVIGAWSGDPKPIEPHQETRISVPLEVNWPSNCAGLRRWGTCQDNALVWCNRAGHAETFSCDREARICLQTRHFGAFCASPFCFMRSHPGICVENMRVWCDDWSIRAEACSPTSEICAQDESGRAACVDACDGLAVGERRCRGNAILECLVNAESRKMLLEEPCGEFAVCSQEPADPTLKGPLCERTPEHPCGPETDAGRCDGDVLTYCDGTAPRSVDCATQGRRCMRSPTMAACREPGEDNCGDVTPEGVCEDEHTLAFCEQDSFGGLVHRLACPEELRCTEDEAGWAECLPPDSEPCGAVTELGECEDPHTLVHCEWDLFGGSLVRTPCGEEKQCLADELGVPSCTPLPNEDDPDPMKGRPGHAAAAETE